MTTLRVIDTGLMPARQNIAVTAALVESHRAGACSDTLRFHLYPPSVLIGCSQNLRDAVNVDYCRSNGIEIARRVTGGGAVYMSPGILAWDVVTERHRFGPTLAESATQICGGVASGLARLGLPAHYRPLNAVEIGGRKVCGAGGAFDGPTLAYQGTVLVTFDITDMASALPQLLDPVTSVATFLGHAPGMAEIKAVLIAGFAEAWRTEIAAGALTVREQALADRLFAHDIGTDAFVAGDDTVSERVAG